MNHTLLHDSIRECQEADKAPADATSRAKRRLIHEVYTRKVKELAALYPFLFVLENGLRGFAAERLYTAFNNVFWWQVFLDAVRRGLDENHFPTQADGKKLIHNVSVNPAFVKEVMYGIKTMSRSQQAELLKPGVPAGRFYEELTLKSLANIIQADWVICPVGSLKKGDFKAHMKTIGDVRNELFHGNPIKKRASLIVACERILDSLDFHLGSFDIAIGATAYTRPTPSVPRSQRHVIPPA